jgi:hypothetical protein
MRTIDEAIIKMDAIVTHCMEQNHRAGFFAVLYRHVTIRIKQGIDKKEFEDNARMERLDVIFALRFFDAYDAWMAQKPTSQCWERAFDAAASNKYLVMQHLLLGINAHINLDLGIAAAQTMENQPLEGLKADFDKINDILASLVDGVKNNISKVSPVFGLLTSLARGKDELLLNFSIGMARDGAWKFAGEYYNAHNKEVCIADRDIKIARLADRLIDPGKWVSFLVKIIRWGEYKSVSEKMKILEDMP